MLLSVLRVGSPTLEADGLLAAHPTASADVVWHTGERRATGRTSTDNGVNLCVVDNEQTWAALIERTLAGLDRLRPLLLDAQRLGAAPEVDFGVSVGSSRATVPSCRFAVDDLRRFAQLGVSVCVTAYPTTEDDDD